MPTDGPKNKPSKISTATHGKRRTNWFGASIALGLFSACAIGIYFLSADARREINALATANADSTQWGLAQSEVELLAVLVEVGSTELDPEVRASNVRRRFDVLYSRISTMQESSVLAGLRQNELANATLNRISTDLDQMVARIDSTDAELISALPVLAREFEDMRSQLRVVSLAGVEYFSREADEQRARVTDALLRLGFLTFLLVAALSAVVLALVKSYRSATRDHLEKAETQKRMSVIVSTSHDAIIVIDLKGHVIEFNEAAEKIFGYSSAEILGQRIADKIIPDKHYAAHESGMERYIKTREKRVVGQGRVQLEAKHKDGHTFPVELSISSADGPDGEIFISYLRDISSRVAKQEELVKARDEALAGERAKAELVAVMSHEMRTPLNGIIGALELMKATELDKTQVNMTEVMSTSADMLLHHVNNVLDMSRLEAGAAETIKRPFNPNSLIKELLSSLEFSAKARGNTLKLVALDPHFNLVLGDPGKLRQILTNLVGNAIKFTKHGQISVEIELLPEVAMWELRVTDDGIGISNEDQARIFDDFVMIDASYTRAQEGTGLGLAIVRRLVSHLGGEIGVESEMGSGSAFWVRLPTNVASGTCEPNRTEERSVPEPEDLFSQASLSVMLVEDNAINRVVAREMLGKLGHRCMEAHNGNEAVELANRQQFDAILMDISMPDMDGVEATHRIRLERGPNADTPIFAVTAHAMPSDVARFKDAGMQEVLVKPIGIDRLRTLLGVQSLAGRSEVEDCLLWDHATLQELDDALGAKKRSDLIEAFVEEMENACDAFFADPHAHSKELIRSEVHRLAGSASILGAAKLRRLLQRTEEAFSSTNPDKGFSCAQEIKSCWHATRTAVPNSKLEI